MEARFIVYFPAWIQNSGEFVYFDEVFVHKTLTIAFPPFIGMKLSFPIQETEEYIELTKEKTYFKTGFFEVEEALCYFDTSGKATGMVFRQQASYEWTGCFEEDRYPVREERDAAILELVYGFGFHLPAKEV